MNAGCRHGTGSQLPAFYWLANARVSSTAQSLTAVLASSSTRPMVMKP